MFIGQMKYLGTSGATFTNNAIYDIVSWNGSSPIVIGDNGTVQTAAVGPDWEIHSLSVLSLKTLI